MAMEGYQVKSKPVKMRAVVIRSISLVGLIVLIAWEVWKAGDMLTSLKGWFRIVKTYLNDVTGFLYSYTYYDAKIFDKNIPGKSC